MVWIYLLGLLPSLGVFGWLYNSYRPSYNFTEVQGVYGPYLGLLEKMAKKYPSEQSGAGPKRMSWDRPCFLLFPVPLKGVKITLQMIRNFLLLHYSLLQQKCGVSCACGWHWQQSILVRQLSGLAFAPIDGSPTSSSFWSYREKEKFFFTLFPHCCVVTSGFSCWPADRDYSKQNHSVPLWGSPEMCNPQFWNH